MQSRPSQAPPPIDPNDLDLDLATALVRLGERAAQVSAGVVDCFPMMSQRQVRELHRIGAAQWLPNAGDGDKIFVTVRGLELMPAAAQIVAAGPKLKAQL